MVNIVWSYERREATAVCNFLPSSEKEYGVQCIIFKEHNSPKEYTTKHINVVKTIVSGKPCKDIAFLHVSLPGKAFDLFDNEKYKLVLLASAYFQLLEFFKNDFNNVIKRMDEESPGLKSKKDWIFAEPMVSYRGLADIKASVQLDSGPSYSLDLVITRRLDINKTSIVLGYSDDTMGLLSLPHTTFLQLSSAHATVCALNDYKEPVPAKKSRQS
jgi:hypothetical protein